MTPSTLAILLVAGLFIAMLIRPLRAALALRKARVSEAREYDMPRVASYFVGIGQSQRSLPTRTWSDLDMDDVFQKIDRTASWPGQHLLYARLHREGLSSDALNDFENRVGVLTDNAGLRAKIRTSLKPLDDWRARTLPALFQQSIPSLPTVARLLPLLTVAGVVCLVGIIWWPQLVLAVTGLALSNVFIRVALRGRTDRLVPALRMLTAMLKVSEAMTSIDEPTLESHVSELRKAVPRLQWIGRASRWLSFEGGNELANAIYEYTNILFLLDVTTLVWCIDAIRVQREAIRRAYVALGELDSLQAIAELRLERSDWTRPVLTKSDDDFISFVALRHPLLDDAKPNSLDMGGENVLLTGSNMSGKSTFIRTVGVNAVLAQTIHTVFATEWRSPRYAVRTVIGRVDSILEGKSYYRAEVEAVGALLNEDTDERRLLLFDEMFRGTNSIERVAAAQAVLAYLSRGRDQVLVATHDVELLELLPGYEAFHFREEIRNGELAFDYQLHAGPCSTKNAIAILDLVGYPSEVVAEARVTAERMEQYAVRRSGSPH